MKFQPSIITFPDSEQLARDAAVIILKIIQGVTSQNHLCHIALAGGNTPRGTYRQIASLYAKHNIDWNNVFIYWSDERYVPHNHPQSNYHMSHDELLIHLPLPENNIIPINTDLPPRDSAHDYEQKILSIMGSPPVFDIIMLGMGPDGHTASIFPGDNAVLQSTNWVEATYVYTLQSWRITFTPKLIKLARNVIILVSGDTKKEVLKHILNQDSMIQQYPITTIQPQDGHLYLLTDIEPD